MQSNKEKRQSSNNLRKPETQTKTRLIFRRAELSEANEPEVTENRNERQRSERMTGSSEGKSERMDLRRVSD